ncbi:hypothetical protein Mapa_001913 [Marchantia paleacea]|nr:hypothetical protein Mapa_001913 [Marchantia paleacea]
MCPSYSCRSSPLDLPNFKPSVIACGVPDLVPPFPPVCFQECAHFVMKRYADMFARHLFVILERCAERTQ